MWLMYGVCKVVAELLDDLLDLVVLFGSGKISDHSFESFLRVSNVTACKGNDSLKSADLSLVIELVVQSSLDAGIHRARFALQRAHGGRELERVYMFINVAWVLFIWS